MTKQNTAIIATVPKRESGLKETVMSLIGQVDKMQIVLNGFDSKQPYKWLDELIASTDYRKTLIYYIHRNNFRGAGERYWNIHEIPDYVYTCDDDLVYPADYIAKTRSFIDESKCVITYHGKVFKQPVFNYFKDPSVTRFRCLGTQINDSYVHVGGTGVMGWDNEQLDLHYRDFVFKNMADILFSKVCFEQNIKILCKAHEKTMFKYNDPNGGTIFDENHEQGELHTQIVNRVFFGKRI